MKTSTIGIVATAILMVVAGVGFGTALAGGNHSDSPVLRFEDQASPAQDGSSSPYVADLVETGNLPEPAQIAQTPGYEGIAENPEDQEFPQVAQSPGNGALVGSPMETGGVPATNDVDSSIVVVEGSMYRAGDDTGGP